MLYTKQEFQNTIKELEKFSKYADITDIVITLKNWDNQKSTNQKKLITDKLEGIMHAEGSGSILVNNKSLPQVIQKILTILAHFEDLT